MQSAMTASQALATRDAFLNAAKDGSATIALDKAAKADVSLASSWLSEMVGKAQITLWRGETWNAAVRGAKSFEGLRINQTDLPQAPQLWILDFRHNGLESPETLLALGMDPRHVLMGLLLTPDAHQVGVIGLYYGPSPALLGEDVDLVPFVFVPFTPLVFGEAYELSADSVAIAAAHGFLQQEFVGLERQTLPRHIRRAAELERRPPLPEIKTIVLRRTARKEREGEGESEAREWSCHWLVSGHWRRQWMPSKATWEPRFISPYVKGDTSKPLRNPKGTVYVAKR